LKEDDSAPKPKPKPNPKPKPKPKPKLNPKPKPKPTPKRIRSMDELKKDGVVSVFPQTASKEKSRREAEQAKELEEMHNAGLKALEELLEESLSPESDQDDTDSLSPESDQDESRGLDEDHPTE
jgi:protein TonB